MATVPSVVEPVLSEERLERFAKRASQYDRDNKFFSEDFDELRDAGYLRVAVPTEFGGAGLSLSDVVRQQRRLAYYAAPTGSLQTYGVVETRRSDGSSKPPPPARSSPPATPRAGTTSRYCSRRQRPNGSTAAIDSPAGNLSAA
jgi:hypothetical protein